VTFIDRVFCMFSIYILLSMLYGWHKRNLADAMQFQVAVNTETL